MRKCKKGRRGLKFYGKEMSANQANMAMTNNITEHCTERSTDDFGISGSGVNDGNGCYNRDGNYGWNGGGYNNG
eukprot:7243119-Ditylum_brightwellii.AAC.1